MRRTLGRATLLLTTTTLLLTPAGLSSGAPAAVRARVVLPLVFRMPAGAVVSAGGLRVVVPLRGRSVWADADTVDGSHAAVMVQSRRDGTVAVYAGAALGALAKPA